MVRFALLAAALVLAALPTPAHASSATLASTNCSPQSAADDGTMVYDVREANGLWNAYVGDRRCHGHPLLAPHDGHRGVTDITPDGRYVLLVTAVGWDRTSTGAQPGFGSQNAIQLLDRRTHRLSTLVRSACTGCSRGVIWPKFGAGGRRIAWAQMLRSPQEAPVAGDWELHVAGVDLRRGRLRHDRAWRDPAGGAAIYEAYGWIPGTRRVVFMSTTRSTATSTKRMQLFTLPDSLRASRAPTRISPKIDPVWKWETASDVYHEFAHFRRDDPNTLYTSVGTNTVGGADLFAYDVRRASRSGLLAQPKRVTYFGGDLNRYRSTRAVPGFGEPRYAIVGSLAFVGSRIVTSVCRDIACHDQDAYLVKP